jgi:hypothetical protein
MFWSKGRCAALRWLPEPLTDLRAAGFSTELRVLAVQSELSSLGILQRYALQKESRGAGRMTTVEAHAAALCRDSPRSLDRVQDERLADRVLIFKRGGELRPAD